MTTRYRLQYTEVAPSGTLYPQDRIIYAGDRGVFAVNEYLDTRRVSSNVPIVVTEHILSDSPGRIVPATEWDVIDEELY